MAYEVLARKWRPKTFDDVVGQEHVTRTLRNAISTGRVAHAYLFVGPRGIGKTTLSRIFAKAINCLHPNGAEPCGECENCRAISEGSALDVIEIDGASNNKVEDVHNILDQIQFAPSTCKYKIYIIDEVHMLTASAFNALLKTLEEPPSHVKFIFATTEGDKVLPTIISRCQRFDLRRIETHDIVKRLRFICNAEQVTISDDALLAIARGAQGGMRDALSALDQLISFKGQSLSEEDVLAVFGLVSRQSMEDLAAAILQGDIPSILKTISLCDSAGKDLRRLIVELMEYFRNLLIFQYVGSAGTDLLPDQANRMEAQAKLADGNRILQITEHLAEVESKLRFALSVRTIIEMALIRCARIAKAVTLDEVLKRLNVLRSAVGSASATMPPVMERVKPEPVTAAPSPAESRPRDLPQVTRVREEESVPKEPVLRQPDEAESKELYDDPVLQKVVNTFHGKVIGIDEN